MKRTKFTKRKRTIFHKPIRRIRTNFPKIYYVQKKGDPMYFVDVSEEGVMYFKYHPHLMKKLEAVKLKIKLENKLYIPLKLDHV